ncbi:MAG: hypothetical protein JOZ07_18085 [Solirubrobacterales bacterium]|nr:hypothetical protein [Solirubrobacterales bacterium]
MGGPTAPDLDAWLAEPAFRVVHRRDAGVGPDALWAAALGVRVADAGLLGRLVRWRIPGLPRDLRFDELFRAPPFVVLETAQWRLVSGLVGRIWTLRRDYPELDVPAEFREWSRRGTARVVFAHWVMRNGAGSCLHSETRVEALGAQGRLGLRAVSPIVRRFQGLVGSEGLDAAVRRAEADQRS